MSLEFQPFPKIARLNRDCVITEKLDGTNAQIFVAEDGSVMAGSRSRWITPQQDNFGFAAWVAKNTAALRLLGPGSHYGEWWGSGIQRGYGLTNGGPFSTDAVEEAVCCLRKFGSAAAPDFMNPEGVIVWHEAARSMFKVTLEKDSESKGRVA